MELDIASNITQLSAGGAFLLVLLKILLDYRVNQKSESDLKNVLDGLSAIVEKQTKILYKHSEQSAINAELLRILHAEMRSIKN